MKLCNICKIEKDLIEFSKRIGCKDGLRPCCKVCLSIERKIYKNKNNEIIKEKDKIYREKNKEKYKKWYNDNKEKLQEYNKIYKEKNKEKIINYNSNNKEYRKIYRKNNKEKINEYQKNRMKTEPLFRLRSNLSNRIFKAFKNKNLTKSKRTLDLLGCDLETAKLHLEKQFTKGMNWENYGKWHVDHIIPCASSKTEEELIKLFHYTNLQPLWAMDNIKKSNKIIEKQLFLL